MMKFCKDCKHYRYRPNGCGPASACYHPSNIKQNPVTADIIVKFSNESLRIMDDKCSRAANWYEETPSFFFQEREKVKNNSSGFLRKLYGFFKRP